MVKVVQLWAESEIYTNFKEIGAFARPAEPKKCRAQTPW